MKTMFRAIPFSTAIAASGLVSCAAVDKVSQGSTALVEKTAAATASKVGQLSDLIHPAGVKVVEVREKDLKPLPTGQERALAFQNTRKQSFWTFSGPVDFIEPILPNPGGETDGSLLPPKSP